MITTINEFFFSKHYAYDTDNRFNLRIKNAKILNSLQNPELADIRLKKALYFYGLEMLDKLAIAIQPIAIVFGNIYFREKGRLIAANIEVDKSTGNVYTALINNQTVITLILLPINISNQEIFDKIKKHDGTEVKQLRDMDGTILSLNDKKRKTIIIDLDIDDAEFAKQYPAITLKNNSINGILSPIEINKLEDEKKIQKTQKTIFSSTAIPKEFTALIPNKEFVIYKGMEILVPYPDGPKKKIIRDLVIDEKGASRKFSLIFENTLKPMSLEIGTNFIISPKMANDTYNKLIDAFNLTDGEELHFQGPINKFNFYKKGKGGSDREKLGIIITPRFYL